jgi:hypothetical protein
MWLIKTDENGLTQWYQTYGGADCETASSLVQTTDGGFALAGATSSYSAEGYRDIWLVKTDANGIVQWNQTYGGSGWDEASSLVQTADGGFALAGWFNRFCTGGDDMCLVKTDANGVTQWSQTYGEIDPYGTITLVQTTDGGFALASSTNSFGAGEYDMWLVKTNENGLALWNQTYGGGYCDGATALVQTADGGFALSGYTNVSNLENYILGQAFSDIGLVKTDENGVDQWNQTYGGLGWEDASALVQTADGGFALSSSTCLFGTSFTNMWLVKTDAIGVPQWNQTYGEAHNIIKNWDTLLIQTVDGGFALTGNTRSSGADSSPNMLLVKTYANGMTQWNQTYGGANLEAWITTGQGTPGLETLSLTTALIVLIALERIKQEKKKKVALSNRCL